MPETDKSLPCTTHITVPYFLQVAARWTATTQWNGKYVNDIKPETDITVLQFRKFVLMELR